MDKSTKATVLGFLIFPGFPMSCLTSAIEPLRAANEISAQPAFGWKLISEKGGKVQSSAEVGIETDHTLNEVPAIDYLFVLSGPLSKFDDPKSANGNLRRLARHGVKMGSFSGGVFPLARAGLLVGHTCSVHWCYEAAFASEFPDHQMTGDVINIDRERYTASGAAAGFDLMLHLIESQLGSDVSTEVACWFQHPMMRGQGVRQKIPNFRSESTSDMLPEQVAKAVGIFSDHIDEPLTIREVANAVGISLRQLERQFKAATGLSPLHYYRSLRMTAARQLVYYSKDTMTQIAHTVGYGTSAQMAHHYREPFGINPAADRRKINLFRVENNHPIPSA